MKKINQVVKIRYKNWHKNYNNNRKMYLKDGVNYFVMQI